MSNRTGNLTNYHSHSLYCDGRANMEDFIRFALSEGFTSYGFSSHAPLPFSTAWTMEWDAMDDYLAEFHRLKAKYAGQIENVFRHEVHLDIAFFLGIGIGEDIRHIDLALVRACRILLLYQQI